MQTEDTMSLIPNIPYDEFENIKVTVRFNDEVITYIKGYLDKVYGIDDPVTIGFIQRLVPHIYNPFAFQELSMPKPSPEADRSQAKARVQVPNQIRASTSRLSFALADAQLRRGTVATPGGILDARKTKKLARYIRNRLDVAMRARFADLNAFVR
jgi:hypothetical protein